MAKPVDRGVVARRYETGCSYELRMPGRRDFGTWRAVRLARSRLLEPTFGEAGRSWGELNTRAVWVERVLTAAVRRPPMYVITEDVGAGSAVIGEMGVAGVDRLSNAGELSGWAFPSRRGVDIAAWATRALLLRSFTGRNPLSWMVAPVSATNPGPVRQLAAIGFEKEATMRSQRRYAGVPADHDLWVLHNSPAAVSRIREELT